MSSPVKQYNGSQCSYFMQTLGGNEQGLIRVRSKHGKGNTGQILEIFKVNNYKLESRLGFIISQLFCLHHGRKEVRQQNIEMNSTTMSST